MFCEYKKNPTDEILIKYKRYKNKLTTIIRHAERQHYTHLLELNKYNLKKSWNIFKNILGKNNRNIQNNYITYNDTVITDSKEIADIFNNYFVNIGSSLSHRIKGDVDPLTYVKGIYRSISTPARIY